MTINQSVPLYRLLLIRLVRGEERNAATQLVPRPRLMMV